MTFHIKAFWNTKAQPRMEYCHRLHRKTAHDSLRAEAMQHNRPHSFEIS